MQIFFFSFPYSYLIYFFQGFLKMFWNFKLQLSLIQHWRSQNIIIYLNQFINIRQKLFLYTSLLQQNNMIGKPRQSKPSNTLYEQVLNKNFQIIETFLSQFHQIFLSTCQVIKEQDQFQAILGKFQHRFSLIQRNNKKNEELISRSSDMYEKKMNSLKQFILEKLKSSSGQKIQHIQIESQPKNNEQVEDNIGKQIYEQYQKHLSEQKKLQQNVNQHVKKLDLQIVNMNMKLNSLTTITNNLDERIRISISLQDKGPICQQITISKQIQTLLKNKILDLETKIDSKVLSFESQCSSLSQQLDSINCYFSQKILDNQLQLKNKINAEQFQELKFVHKDELSCLVREISQTFANKKQTKKMFHLIEKKLLKLEVIEQIIRQNDENNSNISVVPANIYSRTRPSSIHSNKKSQKSELNTKDSLYVRRLDSRKKNQDCL